MPLASEPWSKKHKAVTRHGGLPYNLSNSYANPLTHRELVELTKARGDHKLLEAYNDHSLEYTANGGSLDLREAIAELYGSKIGPDNVLVFTGAQVALQTAALAMVTPGSHTIVFTPCYQSVQEAPVHAVAANAGSEITKITLMASEGWQIDPHAVERAIRPNTKYMVINDPFNPAGTLSSHALQRQVVDIAEKHGIYLLSDEVYRLLEHDPKDRLPAMCDLYRRGLSAVTMSKPWGACGITIGWLAFQDMTIRQRLVDVQYFGTACPSRASEIQAMMVLRASDHILAKNMKIIRHNKALLEAFMHRYSDLFEWVRPKAGAIAFLKFKGPLTSTQLGDVLAKAGISIKPAYVFTDLVTPANDYFRVGFGEEKMPTALAALSAFVDQHKAAWSRKSRL